jgi:hypothetical protein
MGTFKIYLQENEDKLQQIYDMLDELSDEELDDFGSYLYYEFFEDEDEDDENTSDEELDPEEEEFDPDEDIFDIDTIKDMIMELGPEMYSDILDLLSPDEFDSDDDDNYQETDGSEYQKNVNVYETRLEIYEEKGDKEAYQEFLKKAIEKFGGKGIDFNSVPKDKRDELGEYIDKNWESDEEEMKEAVSKKLKVKNRNKKKRKFQKLSKSQLRKGKAKRKMKLRKTKAKRKRYLRKNKKKLQLYRKSRNAAIKQGKHFAKVRRK